MPKIPDDPLAFIRKCVRERRIYWTYHVNMRLEGRHIARNDILGAVDNYEIIESYPGDKYLPSYLVLAKFAGYSFHILFAADAEDGNVKIVTAYRPDPKEWQSNFRIRRTLP